MERLTTKQLQVKITCRSWILFVDRKITLLEKQENRRRESEGFSTKRETQMCNDREVFVVLTQPGKKMSLSCSECSEEGKRTITCQVVTLFQNLRKNVLEYIQSEDIRLATIELLLLQTGNGRWVRRSKVWLGRFILTDSFVVSCQAELLHLTSEHLCHDVHVCSLMCTLTAVPHLFRERVRLSLSLNPVDVEPR